MRRVTYKIRDRHMGKRTVVTATVVAILVAGMGEYGIKKGMVTFAQEKELGNIVENIDIDGMTLERLSEVKSIQESLIFVEESLPVEEVDEVEGGEIQLMSARMIVNEQEKGMEHRITNDLIEEFIGDMDNLDMEYDEKDIKTVGVNSEEVNIIKPGMSTGRKNTLEEVRKATKVVDESYTGKAIKLSDGDRELLERLVHGESGGEGFIGSALVAQTIRDTLIYEDITSISQLIKQYKYSGSTRREPNEDVMDAVSFIFDDGGYVVKHRLTYFYSPSMVNSRFHETQQFIIEHGCHRFFDRVNK